MIIQSADRIKELRENKGITQAELARHLSVTRASVNAWEMGLSVPTIDRLIDLAQYFHVTIDYIIGLSNEQQINVSHLTPNELELIHRMLYYFESVHEGEI